MVNQPTAAAANLPGSEDAAPNWRQRLPVTLEQLERDRRFNIPSDIFAARRRG